MTKDRIVNEFIELTSISSPSGGERQIADLLKKKLTEIGCEVYEDDAGEKFGGTAGNIIAVLRGTVGTPVLLAAHMDRVPNGDNIKHIVTDEKITSDGNTILAADDISGVVSILDGLRRIHESGKPHCDVEVVFTVSEEHHLSGSTNLDYSRIKSKHSYCFDSPGHTGRIINGAPSRAELFIDVYGKSAHAGQVPEKGINALKVAAKVLADMEEGRLDFETTANWSVITAADVVNIVCEHTRLSGEARSRDPKKLQAYIDYVKRHCEEVISKTPAEYKITVEPSFKNFLISPEDELLTTLCNLYRANGIEPVIETGGGGMDANTFNEKGIKSVGVATGYFKNHSVEEEIYIDDLKKAGKVIYDLILAYSCK